MPYRHFLCLLIGILLSPVAGGVQAQAADPFSFVSGPDYAPYVDEKAEGGGIATRVLTEALSSVGQRTSVSFLPWRRGWQATLDGMYVGTFPYAMTPERREEMLFSRSLVMVRTRVFYPAGQEPWWQGRESAAGRSYCRPDGWSDPPSLVPRAGEVEIRRITSADLTGCIRLLASRRVDFLIADAAIIEALAVQAGMKDAIHRGALVTEVPLSVAVPKKRADAERLIGLINDGLANLAKTGRLEELLLQL